MKDLQEKKIKYLLQNDREFFFKTLFPHYIKTADKPIADLHHEWFELLDNEQYLVIVAPREHAKSSIINLADNLFDICNHGVTVDCPYIIIISDTPDQAKEHLENIVEELEGNEALQHFYGKLYKKRIVGDRKKDKWTSDTIITANDVKIQAVGWRFKGRGKRRREDRPSKIVIDDVENDQDVNSDKMRDKLNNDFRKKILNMGSKDTRYRIVGTILHFDSLLNNLYKKPPTDWIVKKYKAIKDNGKALWPEWWDLKRLDRKRSQIGSISFEQEFQNNPLDDTKSIIKRDWIKFYDGQYKTKAGKIYVKDKQLQVITAVDPNASEKEQNDDFAIVSIGVADDGKIYVLSRVAGKFTLLEHAKMILDEYKKLHSDEIWIETAFYQEVLYRDFTRLSGQEGMYPSVFTTKPNADKIRRVRSTQSIYESGFLYIPEYMNDLYEQIIQFPLAAHDDMLDALTMCLQRVKFGRDSVGQGNEEKDRTGDVETITGNMLTEKF